MSKSISDVAIMKYTGNYNGSTPTLDGDSGINVGDVIIDEGVSPANIWCCLDNTSGSPVWQAEGEGTDSTLNYWGNGSDGDVWLSSDLNISNTEDGDVVVKQYSSLTIDENITLTTANRCRGLAIYVSGDATINGTISMTGKGCKCNPLDTSVTTYTPVPPTDGEPVETNGLRLVRLKDTGTDVLNGSHVAGTGADFVAIEGYQPEIDGTGTIYQILRVGAIAVDYSYNSTYANAGLNGSTGQSGGGGTSCSDGIGTAGTCFSGGTGGAYDYVTCTPAVPYGGAGGIPLTGYSGYCGGGAGNPGGPTSATNVGDNTGTDGGEGTGGLLMIFVKGNLTIGANGSIEADGMLGGAGYYYAGGGSGGGNVLILYAGTLTNNGSITANGGGAGVSTYHWSYGAGAGGNGSIQIDQISE